MVAELSTAAVLGLYHGRRHALGKRKGGSILFSPRATHTTNTIATPMTTFMDVDMPVDLGVLTVGVVAVKVFPRSDTAPTKLLRGFAEEVGVGAEDVRPLSMERAEEEDVAAAFALVTSFCAAFTAACNVELLGFLAAAATAACSADVLEESAVVAAFAAEVAAAFAELVLPVNMPDKLLKRPLIRHPTTVMCRS